jgi:hypothetical protein
VTFLADASRFHLISNNVGAAGGVQSNAEVDLDCEALESDPAQDGPEQVVCKKKVDFGVKANGESTATVITITTTGVPVTVATVTLADEGVLPTTREARFSKAAEEEQAEGGNGMSVKVGRWAVVGVAVWLLSQTW